MIIIITDNLDTIVIIIFVLLIIRSLINSRKIIKNTISKDKYLNKDDK